MWNAILEEPRTDEKSQRTVLTTVTSSHVSQHFYVGLSVLYPDMMRELNMNYTQLGVMTGTSSMIAGFLQIMWSLLVRHMPQRVLLGIGNILVSMGCLIMGSSQRFVELIGGNVVSGGGQAAQHPVGTSILARTFSKEKVGRALSIHYGLGYVGNIVSPILLSFLAVSFGWRSAVYVLAVIPLIAGLSVLYFLRGDRSALKPDRDMKSGNLWDDLRLAIRVKGALIVIAAEAFAVGGSGMGVITTYTPVFLRNFLKVGEFETSMIYAFAVVGGVVGTVFFGRLAGRYGNLKIAALITGSSSALILLLSSYGVFNVLIVPHLFIIGATSFGGSSLLQAYLVSVSTPRERDLLIGLYFTLGFGCSSIWTTLTGLVIDAYGSFNLAWLLRAVLGTVAFALMILAMIRSQRQNQ